MTSKMNDTDAIRAAAAVATVDGDEPDINAAASKMVCIRLNEYEHRRMKALFSKAGVPLATGVKMAALYVVEMVEDEALKLTSAAIIDRRG